jgi:hypothetical protein
MKQMGCEHENGVIRALHSGEWTDDLRQHVAGCPDCGLAMHLAEAMKDGARRAERRFNPPDAYWILQRSRRMAREIAVSRMGRLMAAMRALAVVYVVAAAGWLLRGYAIVQYREVASAMHGAATSFAMLGAMVAAVFVVVGLLPILRQRVQRRSSR